MTPALHAALDEALRHGPIYVVNGMRLSSHLPMVLVALDRLDGPPEALRRHLDHWAPRLPPAPALTEDPPTLVQALPTLLAAPESMAFHGAIRLAYALESGHAAEQQAALQAWLDDAQPLGPALAAHPGQRPLRQTLDAVRADAGLALPPREGGTIVDALAAAHALPAFAAHIPSPQLSLDALAEASLAVYLATHDFTALHLVTGTHALRVILEAARAQGLVVDEGQVLRTLWRAWLAAYVSIGRPVPAWALVHAGQAAETDWQQQLPALHASLNDHRVKLADAARQEWRHRGWPGYALCLRPAGAAQ